MGCFSTGFDLRLHRKDLVLLRLGLRRSRPREIGRHEDKHQTIDLWGLKDRSKVLSTMLKDGIWWVVQGFWGCMRPWGSRDLWSRRSIVHRPRGLPEQSSWCSVCFCPRVGRGNPSLEGKHAPSQRDMPKSRQLMVRDMRLIDPNFSSCNRSRYSPGVWHKDIELSHKSYWKNWWVGGYCGWSKLRDLMVVGHK